MGDTVNKHKERFEDFLLFTEAERIRAELRRDFRDLKQWTDKEAETLSERGQAPIVIDYLSKKVDALCGVEYQQRTDPQAYPRTQKHEQASEAITDALRYVEDKVELDEIASEVFEEKLVEGYSGAIVEAVKGKRGFEIEVNQLHWDRIYYDRHSREKDFKDSSYFGITAWMDGGEVKRLFPGQDIDFLITESSGMDSGNFNDRPETWIDRKRKRIRVNQEYFLKDNVWHEVFYCGDTILRPESVSRYLDDDGEPTCPIELESDYVDRDNNRYGWIERLMDPQREINHRRSKGLYLLSSAQVIAEKGAVDDRHKALQELRKAQGFIEVNPNMRFEIDRNVEMGTAQLNLYQEAKAEMDSVGVNPELTGRTDQAISGRAFIARQQGGMTEIARIFSRHSNWKKRVYRQIWARIKQFWDEERWIRVTDERDAMKWVGLNIPLTAAHQLVMQQTGLDFADAERHFGAQIQQAIQQDPRMGQVIEVINDVAEIDMDILIEESPDTITLQQEQFEVLASLFQASPSPQMFEMLIKLSSMRNKQEVLDQLKGSEQQQAAAAQRAEEAAEIEKADKLADIESKKARAAKDIADAEAQDIENDAVKSGLAQVIEAINGQIGQAE